MCLLDQSNIQDLDKEETSPDSSHHIHFSGTQLSPSVKWVVG